MHWRSEHKKALLRPETKQGMTCKTTEAALFVVI
jgi:hypothetical protein